MVDRNRNHLADPVKGASIRLLTYTGFWHVPVIDTVEVGSDPWEEEAGQCRPPHSRSLELP